MSIVLGAMTIRVKRVLIVADVCKPVWAVSYMSFCKDFVFNISHHTSFDDFIAYL